MAWEQCKLCIGHLTGDETLTGDNQRDKRRGARLTQWLAAFARQTRGNVAMMFALALPLLLMVGLGAVDIHQASRVKANLQDALDAAALVAARSSHTAAADIQKAGMDALKANMPDYYKGNLGDTASFVINDNVLTANAKVNVKVLVANIFLPPYGRLLDDYLPVSTSSEVLRASRNVEVGVALDITGSMSGTRLVDLQAAATELIDIVVQPAPQGTFYSKMALAPYAVGVNLGGYADAARGSITPGVTITDLDWKQGTAKIITGITKSKSAVVTANGHEFSNGDTVYIRDVQGMKSVNGNVYQVASVTTNTFVLRSSNKDVDSSNYSDYDKGGTVQKCKVSDCTLVVTANNHGFKADDNVWLDGTTGWSNLNKKRHKVSHVNANSFSIGVEDRSKNTYAATGQAWCTTRGCQFYYFANADNGRTQFEVSSCVSERTGANAYTDVAPATTLFGRSYTDSANNACPVSTIQPLTTSKDTLKTVISNLKAGGSTAGHIGTAWAWYLVSPNFANFWGGDSAPSKDPADKTLKVVVLMTDGEFNSPFCNDVIAKDAGSGSGGDSSHAQCNAPNGNPFNQAVNLCRSMKASGVVVYTVGFNLSSDRGKSGVDTAVEVMETCATDKSTHFHEVSSGTQLRDAFRAIGRDITRLRLAR